MATTEKLAISVPKELVRKARAAVKRGAAPGLSACITRALQETVLQDDLDQLLEEMLARTGGPVTPSEIRQADEVQHQAPGSVDRCRRGLSG